MIRWHRSTYLNQAAVPILFYYTDELDGWTIDRIPVSNGSRTCWYEYDVMYHGERTGMRQGTLKDAKRLVEREGRE